MIDKLARVTLVVGLAIVVGAWIRHGKPTLSIPVVTGGSRSIVQPVLLGQSVGAAIIATNIPTSWSLTDASGDFAIDNSGQLSAATLEIPPATYTVTAHATNASGTGSATVTITVTGGGIVASFNRSPMYNFTIGGDSYEVQTANVSYNIANGSPYTLRFEIHQGDHAWFDGSSVDRSEAQENQRSLAAGTPFTISYQFMLESNGPGNTFVNTSSNFFVISEMHHDDTTVATSPPFAIEIAGPNTAGVTGPHLRLIIRYVAPGGDPSNGSPDLHLLIPWMDSNPLPLNVFHLIQIAGNVDNTGSGYLQLTIDGTLVENYSGLLGYGGVIYYEEGLYRDTSPEIVAAQFRYLTFTH